MKYWAFTWKGTSLLWQCHHWHQRVWSTCQRWTWSTSQRRTWSTCQHRWQTWRTAAKCGDRLHHRLGSISPGSWESKVIKQKLGVLIKKISLFPLTGNGHDKSERGRDRPPDYFDLEVFSTKFWWNLEIQTKFCTFCIFPTWVPAVLGLKNDRNTKKLKYKILFPGRLPVFAHSSRSCAPHHSYPHPHPGGKGATGWNLNKHTKQR